MSDEDLDLDDLFKIDNEKEEEFDFDPDMIMTDQYMDPIYSEYDFLGFDLNLLKRVNRDKLRVNLIYFD